MPIKYSITLLGSIAFGRVVGCKQRFSIGIVDVKSPEETPRYTCVTLHLRCLICIKIVDTLWLVEYTFVFEEFVWVFIDIINLLLLITFSRAKKQQVSIKICRSKQEINEIFSSHLCRKPAQSSVYNEMM